MSFILLPSLRHAALVRTASLLYNQCEIQNMLEKDAEIPEDERWELIKREIAEKLSSLLPAPLPKAVSKVIRPMHDQVVAWKWDHDFLLKHIGTCCCTYLCWNTDGTIDRARIAKKIVVNDSIDPKIRFILACTYFLEKDIEALWEKYEEIKRDETALHDTNLDVRFWMEWLKKKCTKHWSEVIDEFFRNRSLYPSVIRTRVSCFYHLLSRESKQSIDILNNHDDKVHRDDIIKCLKKMDDSERMEIFRSCSMIPLMICLRWPFQSLFIGIAEVAIGFLTLTHFRHLLRSILFEYLDDAVEDFDIFEKFWQISPAEFKGEVKIDRFIAATKDECLLNENIPQGFKEILRKCFD